MAVSVSDLPLLYTLPNCLAAQARGRRTKRLGPIRLTVKVGGKAQ